MRRWPPMRSCFAATVAGQDKNQTKPAFLQHFGITSARVELEGRIRAVKESQATQVEQPQQRIRQAERVIAKKKRRLVLHQNKRRLARFQS
ncbi:MAG: hypothetical protein NZ482_08610 [Gloeomargarita sp. SKYG98]|nr:hypothetical protein [Gloeomargarita sp. SKYG98]